MLSLLKDQGDGLLVKGNEGFATQPIALIGDQAVGEISAFLEDRQAGISSRTVDGDIAGVEQCFERGGNVLLPEVVNPAQDPNELA